jgi:hypothetical protein
MNMRKTMDSLKLRYFKWHLATSLIVVILISLICQWLWFPSPFLLLDGTWIALLILGCVDITLGPLLTLLLVSSKKKKRELTIDIIAIGLIQISALTYGLKQIEQERVVALVHFENIFHAVTKKDIVSSQESELSKLGNYKGMIYAQIDYNEVAKHYSNSTVPALYSSYLYLPASIQTIKSAPFPLDKVPEDIKSRYDSSYTFKSLAGKKRNAVIVLIEDSNTSTMAIVDILPLPEPLNMGSK